MQHPSAGQDTVRPLYEKVYRCLRDEILAGKYSEHGVLPSEKVLEQRFSVSRITVRRALDVLDLAGFITRSKGRSTRVVEQLPPLEASVEDEIANTVEIGRTTQASVLTYDWMQPPRHVADSLNLGADDKVLLIVRLRRRHGRPICHTVAILPAPVGQHIAREDLPATPLIELMQRHGHVIARFDQTVRAAPCPDHLAQLLDLGRGEPVLRIERVGYDAGGRPLQHIVASFRWDSFGYRVSLVREPAAETFGAPAGSAPAAAEEL